MSFVGKFARSKKPPITRKISQTTRPSGVERHFGQDDIIVSKTDLKGRLTYVNDIFIDIASFTEEELIGAPHSTIRHPDMPRCVFRLLWDTVQAKKEIFAYVVNMSRNGDHYWVFAHVTPSFSNQGEVVGYHSNRRIPDRRVLDETIIPLYQALLAEEGKHTDRKQGIEASAQMLTDILAEKEMAYDQFVFSL